jgi:hypothetical protein
MPDLKEAMSLALRLTLGQYFCLCDNFHLYSAE